MVNSQKQAKSLSFLVKEEALRDIPENGCEGDYPTLCSNGCNELDFPKIHLQPLFVIFVFCAPASDSLLNTIVLFIQSSVVSTEVPRTWNRNNQKTKWHWYWIMAPYESIVIHKVSRKVIWFSVLTWKQAGRCIKGAVWQGEVPSHTQRLWTGSYAAHKRTITMKFDRSKIPFYIKAFFLMLSNAYLSPPHDLTIRFHL